MHKPKWKVYIWQTLEDKESNHVFINIGQGEPSETYKNLEGGMIKLMIAHYSMSAHIFIMMGLEYFSFIDLFPYPPPPPTHKLWGHSIPPLIR